MYESATGYGLRKALNTKKDEFEGQKREIDLEKQIEESHNEIEKLKGMQNNFISGGINLGKNLYFSFGHSGYDNICRTYWSTKKSRNTRA